MDYENEVRSASLDLVKLMPEVKETVFPIVYVRSDEAHTWVWNPATHEMVTNETADGNMITTVQPKGERKGERKAVDLDETDAW